MPSPIIIIGHWRSGTTHLYNLLTRAEFGFVTPVAAGLPHEFLTLGRWLRPFLVRMLPKTRYVDQVEVRPDSPQEDEIPLGSMNPISFYHGIYFPKNFHHHFRRSLFSEGCTVDDVQAWRQAFSDLTDKLWLDHGQRLVIKNPTYTARIPLVRSVFPDARFIHIYRNPHDVFRSTRRFYRKLLEQFAWQPFDHLDIDQVVLEGYQRMMDQLDRDKHTLPDNRFVEVRFEDLENRPMTELRRLYQQLELGEAASLEPTIQAYLRTIEGFEKTTFEPSLDDHALVNHQLAPFLHRFGYPPPGA